MTTVVGRDLPSGKGTTGTDRDATQLAMRLAAGWEEPRTGDWIRLLGSVRVECGHGAERTPLVQVPGTQLRIAFAILVLERARGVSREELADAIWPEALPETWESALRTIVSKVRGLLASSLNIAPEVVLTSRDGRYYCNIRADASVDVEDAIDSAKRAAELVEPDPAHASDMAHRSADALRTPLLPESDSPWTVSLRDRLTESLVVALETLSAASSRLGDHVSAVRAANEAVATAHYRESTHRTLIAAHAAAGNRAEALVVYQQLRQLLADELGVDPDPVTEDLYLSLLGTELEHSPSADVGGLRRPEATFVGRESELTTLANAWRSTRSESAKVVLISCAAGAGKSMLCRQFARQAAADGALVLFGSCSGETDIQTAFAKLLTPVWATMSADERNALGSLGDWWDALRPNAPVTPRLQPMGSLLHDAAVVSTLCQLAADRPLLVVLEDLDQASSGTLSLLASIATGDRRRVMVLATRRTSSCRDDETVPLPLVDLARSGGLITMPLAGLSVADVHALLGTWSGDEARRRQLAERLVADTSGNASMIAELVVALTRHGSLPETDDAVEDVDSAELRRLLDWRVAEVGHSARDMLRYAAAEGQVFHLEIVAAAAGLDGLEAVAALEELIGRGIVVEFGARCEFVQPILRRHIYRRLTVARRRLTHRHLAAAIERAGSSTPHDAMSLARHYAATAEGGLGHEAVTWALAAASHANRIGNPGEAVRWCRAALAQVPVEDRELAADARTELGLAHLAAGDVEAAEVLIDAAVEALHYGRPAAAARAVLGLVQLTPTDPSLAVVTATLAGELVGADWAREPRDDCGEAMWAQLVAHLAEGTNTPPKPVVRKAAEVLDTHLASLSAPERALERIRVARALRCVAASTDDTVRTVRAIHEEAMAHALRGDRRETERCLTELAGTPGAFDKLQSLHFHSDRLSATAMASLVGLPSHRGAGPTLATRNPMDSSELGADQRAAYRYLVGRTRTAHGLGVSPKQVQADLSPRGALMAACVGDVWAARLAIRQFIGRLDPVRDDGSLHAAGLFSFATLALGDAELAADLSVVLQPYSDMVCAFGYRSFLGPVALHLYWLAALAGDHLNCSDDAVSSVAAILDRVGASQAWLRLQPQHGRDLRVKEHDGDSIVA